MTDCHAAGTVRATGDYAGGISGTNDGGTIKNSVGASNMGGGSIVGGLFLQEFVDGKPWAHLDIAAVNRDLSGSQPHSAKGGSGFGASLMYHIVKQLQK